MAMTAAKKRAAAIRIATEAWNEGRDGTTVPVGTDALEAAVESINTAMDTVISTIPGAWQSKTIKQALIDNLPQPFKSASTGPEKALAMTAWALAEAGLI